MIVPPIRTGDPYRVVIFCDIFRAEHLLQLFRMGRKFHSALSFRMQLLITRIDAMHVGIIRAVHLIGIIVLLRGVRGVIRVGGCRFVKCSCRFCLPVVCLAKPGYSWQ